MESLKGRDHYKDTEMDRRLISQWILGNMAEGVDWINLAECRDRWQALVKTVMNLRVPLNFENSLLLAS
jgi:hypothetical protein